MSFLGICLGVGGSLAILLGGWLIRRWRQARKAKKGYYLSPNQVSTRLRKLALKIHQKGLDFPILVEGFYYNFEFLEREIVRVFKCRLPKGKTFPYLWEHLGGLHVLGFRHSAERIPEPIVNYLKTSSIDLAALSVLSLMFSEEFGRPAITFTLREVGGEDDGCTYGLRAWGQYLEVWRTAKYPLKVTEKGHRLIDKWMNREE